MNKATLETLERYWRSRKEFEKEYYYLSLTANDDDSKIRLKNLKLVVNSINSIYKSIPADLKKIVDMRYSEIDYADWIEIADQLNYSTQKVLKKRTRIMELTAKKIGFL